MDFLNIGDKINVKDYNSLVYLLRKFKRLNTGLRLGSLSLESDYGSFTFDKALTSVGGNFIIEEDVNVSSSDCLRNCFYSFVFSVIDVNTSGTVNKRQVKVTGGTGDDGSLFVTLPTDLIESDEVILPDFELDIVFDEHEYYTPVVDVVNVELVSDKRFVGVGETATVTATLSDREGELLVGVPCNFLVNGVTYSEVTDENGQAEWSYTGTGVSTKIDIRVVTTRLTIYDSVMTATVTGGSVRLGQNMIATGDILIDWGDGTTTTKSGSGGGMENHTYNDGQSEHNICFVGEITSFGYGCFLKCKELTSITIPNTVTSFGQGCFNGCTGLMSIVIPNSVTSIGKGCFWQCNSLTSVSIPSTVSSIGDYCFYGCSSLVDYQLYWKDSAIIEYNSDTMPVKSNTYFTIPQGQRTQYLNKNYPNKIKIRGYDLSITTDKTIIETDETSTVTATLTYNMEPISDETVSYTIRQGGTVIDTGSDTTDSNGEIEIEYTGTSIGKINIIFTYDTLTESTTIYDTINYDNATTTDHHDIWVVNTSTNPAILTRGTTYSTLAQQNTGTNGYMFHNITDRTNKIIEFDIQTTGTTSRVGLRNRSSTINVIKGFNGKWNHIIIDFDNNIVYNTTTGTTNTISSSAINRIYFEARGNGESVYFKNFMVYGSSGSSKVDTSISISSDKASYYTDESIVLSGVLVDDDSLPLVNADVKVYRGASLVDTVSTDSTGTYEKSVTGLSAGSYSFKAVYDGDDTYQGSTSSSLSVIVQNHSYSLSISSDKQIILTTESVTITGTLLKDSTPYSSQSVDLYDGVTKIATLTTDGSGEYEETVSGLSVGVHTFKAINSNAESSTISITVNEPTHTYSLSIASDKQSILTTESVTLSGQLLMDSSPYASQTVQLYDGSTLISTLTTDSDGEYEEILTGLSVGTHTFKAVNSNAESSTVTVTVTEPTPVHDYSLSVASTKDILSYADSESATITATLKDNGVAVDGETLTYTIKHGATTIDTGSDTTDSSGQITFTYASSGIGDVTVEVDFGILLQETYGIEDCVRYDPATSDKTTDYSYSSTVTSFTHSVDHYEAVKSVTVQSGANYYSPVYIDETLPTNFEISVDLNISGISNYIQTGLCVSDAHITTYQGVNECSVLKNSANCGLFYRVSGSLTNYSENTNLARDTWYKYLLKVEGTSVTAKIIRISDNTVMYNQTKTLSNIQSWKKWNLLLGYDKQTLSFKNLKIKAL